MTPTQMLFSFKGRIRRRDYWLFSILVGVVMVLAYVIAAVLGVDITKETDKSTLVQFGVSLALAWPSLAIGAKRCHDRNQSGWWQLLSLIPIVGGFWTLINLGILDGTQGRNRFGVSPKGIGTGFDSDVANVFA
jgi:uncharacterized membrane protein YhaH (DUF805 family)